MHAWCRFYAVFGTVHPIQKEDLLTRTDNLYSKSSAPRDQLVKKHTDCKPAFLSFFLNRLLELLDENKYVPHHVNRYAFLKAHSSTNSTIETVPL